MDKQNSADGSGFLPGEASHLFHEEEQLVQEGDGTVPSVRRSGSLSSRAPGISTSTPAPGHFSDDFSFDVLVIATCRSRSACNYTIFMCINNMRQ